MPEFPASSVRRGLRKPFKAEAGDADAVSLNFDFHAEPRETIQRAAAIGRRGKMRDFALRPRRAPRASRNDAKWICRRELRVNR